ncbi:transcriptional regulator, ArsR family [Pseudogulbenkiania subflava DSM 22618]|uniref:Transcriptional regulator, ArsR family n=2 Tax=Pseudogulbenkiania subflava TaxID=451637 RepID=A0A1Y6CDL4_9NEIS|nr:transcriptional regulator, ArsR family [Pseudogulbenkiania subflava DSM 22618]
MLSALAQESRLAIFRLLVEAGPAGRSAGQVAEVLAIAPATLSFHLKELARAGLIEGRQDGRYVIYSACFAEMTALIAYLSENCCRASVAADAASCGTPPSPGETACSASAPQEVRLIARKNIEAIVSRERKKP